MNRRFLIPVLTLPLAAVLFAVAATGFVGPEAKPALAPALAKIVARTEAVPGDYTAWAALGLTYVEMAASEGKPELHRNAQSAIERSLAINKKDNFVGYGAMAALWAARHEFGEARVWAKRGLAVNPNNALLYGVLTDAELQTGRYDAAFAAAQRMIDISPDTASLSRVSYTWEVRGDTAAATDYMQRALDAASNADDEGFARYFLGELKFHQGDHGGALAAHEAALQQDPTSMSALQGKAKAQAALGRVDAALANYARVLRELPQPEYHFEYGELLESVGRTDEARAQFDRFLAGNARFVGAGDGAPADIDITLYNADHGDTREAVRLGRRGVSGRKFVEMKDAYAWALHRDGRHREALKWADEALALGTRSALFYYHRGMIQRALGNDDAARADLQTALRINPQFNPLGAPKAKAALAALGN